MTKSGTATGATAADGLTAETSGTDETLADFEVVVGKNKRIPFTAICQYPELPTGCEVTSLSMVFNHYGHPCDKCDIADYYLTKGEVGTVDFHEAFEGDPRDESSYGCYANVIVKAAEIAVDMGQLSTTKLQRILKLGYAKAARIVDALEERGVVGPSEGAKARKVLMTPQELTEWKLRIAAKGAKVE